MPNIKTSLAKSHCTPHILNKTYLAHFFGADIFLIFILLSSLLAFPSTSKLGYARGLGLELAFGSYAGSLLCATWRLIFWEATL